MEETGKRQHTHKASKEWPTILAKVQSRRLTQTIPRILRRHRILELESQRCRQPSTMILDPNSTSPILPMEYDPVSLSPIVIRPSCTPVVKIWRNIPYSP